MLGHSLWQANNQSLPVFTLFLTEDNCLYFQVTQVSRRWSPHSHPPSASHFRLQVTLFHPLLQRSSNSSSQNCLRTQGPSGVLTILGVENPLEEPSCAAPGQLPRVLCLGSGLKKIFKMSNSSSNSKCSKPVTFPSVLGLLLSFT